MIVMSFMRVGSCSKGLLIYLPSQFGNWHIMLQKVFCVHIDI
jgi:hypothetical protein